MPWIQISETVLLHAETGAYFQMQQNTDSKGLERLIHKAPNCSSVIIVQGNQAEAHRAFRHLIDLLDSLNLIDKL